MKYLNECPLCGSKNIKKYGKQSLIKQSTPKNFIGAEDQFLLNRLNRESWLRFIYLCSSCSLLFQNPTYDEVDLKNIYKDRWPKITNYYRSVQNPDRNNWSPLIKRNLKIRQRRYANAILTHGGTKILDYGGNRGTNLMHPSLSSSKMFVYDFGRSSVPEEGITSITNLNDSHRFDFILHTHVLEHETDPLSSLKKLRQIMAPDGSLYLEVPFEYAERILTRRPGSIWHVNYFNRKSIMKIADRTGWMCEAFKISYLPYNHFFMNCIVAIMKPCPDGLNCNGSENNLQLAYDMGRSLLTRLILESYHRLRG